MKNYIKPTFMVASLGVTALAGANCELSQEDKGLILGVLEIPEMFNSGESCEFSDESFDMYCKFTAADDTNGISGARQLFYS